MHVEAGARRRVQVESTAVFLDPFAQSGETMAGSHDGAASAICNLVFLPLAFASGFFTPMSELPSPMQTLAPWLPTYHFGQLAYQVVMPVQDVAVFTGRPVGNRLVDLACVVASFVVMGAIALRVARRYALTARI